MEEESDSIYAPPTDILSYVDLVILSSCILVIITSMFNISYGLSISILCTVGSILFAMLNESMLKFKFRSNVLERNAFLMLLIPPFLLIGS